MAKVMDHPMIKGAAHLLDIRGVLAWRGTRDPAEVSARLMDEAWAMFGVALKDVLPAAHSARATRHRLRRRVTPAAHVARDADVLVPNGASVDSSWPPRDDTVAKALREWTGPKSSAASESDLALRRYLTDFGKLLRVDGREGKALFFISVGYTNQDMDALTRMWTPVSEAGINNDPAFFWRCG